MHVVEPVEPFNARDVRDLILAAADDLLVVGTIGDLAADHGITGGRVVSAAISVLLLDAMRQAGLQPGWLAEHEAAARDRLAAIVERMAAGEGAPGPAGHQDRA